MGVDAAAALPFGIPGEWLTQIGAGTLVTLFVLAIMTGRLVPRAIYLDKVRECEQWREVALKAGGQADALLPAATITAEVTRALGDQASAAMAQALTGKGDPK